MHKVTTCCLPGRQGSGRRSVEGHCDPAGHVVHDMDPSILYVPGVQGPGVESTEGQAYPAGQTKQDVALPMEYVPVGQSRGASMEVLLHEKPGGHGIQEEEPEGE